MKKKILIIIVIILVVILACLGIFKITTYKDNKISKDSDAISAIYPFIYDQEEINDKLDSISKDKKYTFNNAYVELNPYGISPLSGIIIFNTDESNTVDVYINDIYFTTMDSSKIHSIPIYGLYEDYDNIVKLVMGSESVTYNFKTAKSNIEYPIDVITSDTTLNDDIYFLEGSMVTGLTGWDKSGNLRFYLTQMLKMDVEWLDNGHFIIGTEQGNDLDGYEALDRYCAFVEMDYLGKVYNYYTVPYGYDFESQVLSNGDIMIGGGTSPIYYDEQVVYTFNMSTSKVTSYVNLSEIIKSIDSEFDSSKLGPSAGKNGFYYDEDTKELLVSFRQLNALINFDYDNKTINWVLTDSSNKYFSNDVWNKYLLDSDIIPKGQHSPQILGNGLYAFYNNNYDRINVSTSISDYDNLYSEAIIFSVNDNIAKVEWSSSSITTDYFTQKYGLFRVLENGNKLINFGWIPTSDYLSNKTNTFQAIEGDVDNTYAVFYELDSDNNILFEATCDEGKYRIFKHSIYNKTTSNTNFTLNIYENISESSYSKVNISDYDIDNALEFVNYFEFTKNTFYTKYDIQESDEIKLLFVGKNSYEFTYKEASLSNINKVFNLNLPNGNYDLYIIINGNIMSSNKKYYFD
jgi:hypothetical protein